MEKRLRKVGNGLALFIDKPLQKLLHFEDGTVVTLATDGIKLVIEPTGESKEPRQTLELEPWLNPSYMRWTGAKCADDSRVAYGAFHTLTALCAVGLTDEIFRHLYRGPWLCRRGWGGPIPQLVGYYRECLCQAQERSLKPADFASMHRLESALQHREDGVDWDAACVGALEAVPLLPEESSPHAEHRFAMTPKRRIQDVPATT